MWYHVVSQVVNTSSIPVMRQQHESSGYTIEVMDRLSSMVGMILRGRKEHVRIRVHAYMHTYVYMHVYRKCEEYSRTAR